MLITENPPPKSLKLKMSSKYELREYQKKVVDAAIENNVGIMQIPTGSGKTIIAGHIWKELERPGVFFVHTKDLLYQAIAFMEEMLEIPIGQIGDGKLNILPITVATIQTTAKAMGYKVERELEEDMELENDAAMLIRDTIKKTEVAFFDECHHIPAETFYNIAINLPNAFFRYGLSATPYRSDRHDMMIEAALGRKIVEINSSTLIKDGYLVKPEITFYPVPPVKLPKGYQAYHKIYKMAVVENEERNKLIAGLAKRYCDEGKCVLILVQQIQHGKKIHKLIKDSVFLTGKDTSTVRNNALRNFKEGKIKLVIATTLADEGLDLPNLEVLVLAGAGQSETRAFQRIGRALRPYPGKDKAIVIDFMDKAPFLIQHSQKRLELYRTEKKFIIKMPGIEENLIN